MHVGAFKYELTEESDAVGCLCVHLFVDLFRGLFSDTSVRTVLPGLSRTSTRRTAFPGLSSLGGGGGYLTRPAPHPPPATAFPGPGFRTCQPIRACHGNPRAELWLLVLTCSTFTHKGALQTMQPATTCGCADDPLWFHILSSRGHHHWWAVGLERANAARSRRKFALSCFAPWTEAFLLHPGPRAHDKSSSRALLPVNTLPRGYFTRPATDTKDMPANLAFQSTRFPVATLSGQPREHMIRGCRIWPASQHANPRRPATETHDMATESGLPVNKFTRGYIIRLATETHDMATESGLPVNKFTRGYLIRLATGTHKTWLPNLACQSARLPGVTLCSKLCDSSACVVSTCCSTESCQTLDIRHPLFTINADDRELSDSGARRAASLLSAWRLCSRADIFRCSTFRLRTHCTGSRLFALTANDLRPPRQETPPFRCSGRGRAARWAAMWSFLTMQEEADEVRLEGIKERFHERCV